jgi:hypothetical protein
MKVIKLLTLILVISSLSYYLVKMEWNLEELVRFCGGITLLWIPLGACFYLLLKKQVEDSIVCFTFSAIASYTLTTLAYFGLAVLKLEPLFYSGQIAILLWLIIYSIRHKLWLKLRLNYLVWPKFDWVLASLIAVSLVVNIPYQIAWQHSPKNDTYKFNLYADHLYHTGQAYELARHVPPQQQSIRAGTPERAYHMFPHLTTMLLSRFTGQTDMLRVHIVYHYIIIEIGMCLALYSIIKTLTKNRIAGYIGTASMYITAISYPPLVNNVIGYFYFTLFPHVSSGLEPVILTSPQMYSGMLVTYGILLGVLIISVRFYQKRSVDAVLIITAIMVAATIRFRLHVFIIMLPGFLLLATYGWKFTRQKVYLVAAGLVLALSLLIYLEMQSPIYMAGTASLKLGFNRLTQEPGIWINSWPFSGKVYALLKYLISSSEILEIVWQIVSMSTFVALNMIGMPLLISANIYLFSKSSLQEFRLFTFLIVWMTVVSTLGAMCLTTDYDNYSVGGQLLLHTRWYIFLLMIPGLCKIYQFFQPHLSFSKPIQISVVIVFTVLSLVVQQLARPSIIMSKVDDSTISLNANERKVLAYIHDYTPQNSVVLTDKYVGKYTFPLSGIAGRAAYLEAQGNAVDLQSLKLNPLDNRQQVIQDLWKTSKLEQFCQILTATSTTHLIEYSNHPLLVRNPPCIQFIWEISNQNTSASSEKITIWQVNR